MREGAECGHFSPFVDEPNLEPIRESVKKDVSLGASSLSQESLG